MPVARAARSAAAALAEAVGFRYKYDDKSKQFAHAAVAFVLTPEGKISRYLYGVDVQAARPALRPGRGERRSGGHHPRSRAAHLLQVRPDDPELHALRLRFRPHRGAALLRRAGRPARRALAPRVGSRRRRRLGMNEWLQTLNELMRRLLFLPEQASTFATRIDRLHYFVFIVTMVSSVGVGLAAVYFFFRYRERHEERLDPHRGPQRALRDASSSPSRCSSSWSGCSSASRTTSGTRTPPKDAMDVYVTGKKWMWHFAYPDGPNANATLTVPARRPVRLLMTSRDVIHSFFVPEFRIKQDVIPGRYTETWFEATKAGPLPDLLHRVLRHLALADGGRGGGAGAGRLRRLAGQPAAGAGRPGRHQRRRRVRPRGLPRRPGRPRPAAGGGAGLLQVPLARRHSPTSGRPGSTSTGARPRCRPARPSSPTRAT